MKSILGLLFIAFGGVSTAAAYELYVTEVTEPYQIIPLEAVIEEKQAYVSVLEGYPVMYEVVVEATTTLSARLSQRYRSSVAPLNFGLMVVRTDEQGGGVTEVGRSFPSATEWEKRKDRVYGMTFWDTDTFSSEVGPGTYRIEVSTPENKGAYRLIIGENDEGAGYFKTLGQIYTTQKTFGLSFLSLLRSSYVYYPLGIMLLLFAIQRTWKYRKTITNVP